MIITDVKRNLLADYNTANKLKPAVEMTDIVWLNLEVFIKGQTNSRITMVALDSSMNYSNRTTLYFNRRSIANDLHGQRIPGKPGDYTTLHQIVKVLRERLGVPVFESEFINTPISATPTVTLTASLQSMAYLPGTNVVLAYDYI